MPTYSEWLTSTTTAFANAMSSAYTNRNTSGNDFYLAWQDMTATSDLNSILPPGSTAFWNTGGPTAEEADILLFRDWLQDNPVTAGRLGLEPTISFRSDLRTQLGNAGNVGTEKRRWKGSPLYTFANGVLVGKDGNIAAAIGTEGGTDIEGFGTDTITYFDGIPFSTGTGIPGSTVIGGDAVVSGSIRGTGGVVVIPDVIQLEQDDTITAPAGIGVDSDGKIRLRHRGEGFLDLVDEIATAETDATNAAKLFTATQNTSSGRFGMSLIPNSNFSYKSIDPTTFAETFANIISVGTTSNILSESSPGVGEFEANAGGICFSAFPTTSERYAVRIRFEGDVAETADDTSIPEGLFVTFNETTDDLPDGKYYVFNDSNIGPSSGDYQGSEVHTANVSVVTPMLSDGGYATTDAGGNIDGLTVPSSMAVSSFLYKPSSGAKNASMVIFAKNFGDGSDRSIRIDYIVLNESPQTTTEIEGIVDLAVTDITGEDDISIVPDKHMADKDMWATRGTSVTLTDSDDGGDPAEDAIQAVFANASGGGIISSAIQCESDRYLVGCKIKVTDASSGDPVISMFAIENLTQAYPTIGGADTSPITAGNEVGFDIMEVSANNSYLGTANSSVTLTDDGNFHTLLGTYETTVTYMDDQGTEYTTYDPSRTPHGTTPILLPSVFSVGIQVDRPCTLLIDYVYGRVQGSSVNIVEGLATAAYTDAEGFVTAMNELVIKESGSIINNSSMGLLDSSGLPLGWMTNTDCTMTFDNTGDYAITITREGSGNRRLITPTFAMGTADKFSIGIRIKSTDSTGITPTINTVTTAADVLPTGYVTMNYEAGGYPTKVYTTGVSQHSTGITMSPSSGITSYDTMLGTWERTSAGQEQSFVGGLAAIFIDCEDDFTVDYIFVKEQTVSYDLADARAEARKDEAIAQAAGFVVDIGDTIAQESGSLLTNADFNSWYKESTYQRPQKWLVTRGATNPRRVIRSTEVSNEVYNAMADPVTGISTARDAEVIDDVNQTGSSIRFSPSTGSGGILSAKWQLPLSDADAVTAGEATTGAYTVSARVKVGSSSVIGIRIYAHESFDYTDASQEHVFCEDGTYGSATVEGADRTSTGTPLDSLFMFADGATTGQVTRVGVINISNPSDTTPGYDPNYTNDDVDNDYADAGDDQFVEYIPIDNDGEGGYEDGDLDATIENTGLWYDIGGTFRPDGKTKCVSFEILIDGDPDSAGGAPTDVYVDYVSLIQQPFDADFATTLADARVNSLTGISSSSFSSQTDPSTGATNTTLAAAILANQTRIYNAQQALAAEDETTTLIPNSFFSDHTTNTPDLWLPTRNTDGTITLEDDSTEISNAGSYNTYIYLGGTNDIRGILSSAIPVIGDGDNTLGLTSGGLTTNPKFDLAIRYKTKQPERTVTIPTITSDNVLPATPAGDYSATYPTYTDGSTLVTDGSLPAGIDSSQEWNVGGVTHYAEFALPAYSSVIYLVFYLREASEEDDPDLEFYDSGNSLIAISGVVSLWNANGVARTDGLGAFSGQSKITEWTDDGREIADEESYEAGLDKQGWVVVKIETAGVAKVKFQGQGSVDTYQDRFFMSYPHTVQFGEDTSTEQISFSILAHEYYDATYDAATYKYVYANGANYIHPAASNGVVQRYNTGVAGQVQSLNTLLNNGVDTTEETEKVTSSSEWQTLVGLYEPNTLARWVSFEFVIDHDDDNDDILPDVFVDGILLQASQETPLLDSVKTTAEAAAVAAGNAETTAANAETTATNAANDVIAIELAQTEAAIVQAGIASEQGSILFNAGFTQSISATNKALPKGFFPFQETPHLFRITNETGTQTSSDLSSWGTQGTDQTFNETSGLYESTKSIYLDVGQTGSALVVTGTDRQDPYTSGFYTTAIPLPAVTADVISTIDGSTNAQADRGNYSIAIKVKPAGSRAISVQLRGNEVNTTMDPESYVHSAYLDNNVYHLYGYDADWNTDAGAPTLNSYSNYIPLVKISETDTTASGWEIIQPNQWTTLIGTFTPQATSQFASFALWFTHSTDDEVADPTAETTPDGPAFWDDWTFDSTDYTQRALVYVDFILVTPATVSANLANDIAAGKAYEVQQTLEADLTVLEDNLGAESDSLLPNGNFLQTFQVSSTNYAKSWMPTGDSLSDATKIRMHSQSFGSIGTYVKFDKNATNNTSGMISKAIQNPAQLVRSVDADGNEVFSNFNIGVRLRGTKETVTSGLETTQSLAAGVQVEAVGNNSDSNGFFSGTIYSDGLRFDRGDSQETLEPTYQYVLPLAFTNNAIGGDTVFTWTQTGSNTARYAKIPVPSNTDVRDFTELILIYNFTPYFASGTSYIRHGLYSGSTAVTTDFQISYFLSNDGGANWTLHEALGDGNAIFYRNLSSGSPQFYNGGQSDTSNLVAVRIAFAGYDVMATNNPPTISTAFDHVRVDMYSPTNKSWAIAKGAAWLGYGPRPQGTEAPDFSVSIKAHESFLGQLDSNVIVVDSNTTIGTPHTDTGISVTPFASGAGGGGQVQDLNIIDLRYSQSSPSTTIMIVAEDVDDDTGESIRDWREIVGSYQPSPNATAVSFEIIVDHDVDGDADLQEVWLDSMTLAQTSMTADLATTIADNRVFVEQNFRGGQGSIHASNVIQNPNFNESIMVEGVKYPAGWTSNSASWGYDDSESSSYDRVVTLPSDNSSKAVSRPFEILSTKYRCKITYKATSTHTTGSSQGLRVYLGLTDQAVSRDNLFGIIPGSGVGFNVPNPSLIRSGGGLINSSFSTTKGYWTTSMSGEYSFISYLPDDADTLYYINGYFTKTNDTLVETILFDIEMPELRPDRPFATYGSLAFGGNGNTSYKVYEVQLIPIGQTYGSGAASKARFTTAYDTDGDPLPDAPRETSATTPLYSALDIEVHDSVSDSSQDSAIMVSMPRKHFPTTSSDDPDGISYFYPGVTDFYYRNQSQNILYYDGDTSGIDTLENCRTLDFPNGTHNRIINMNYIRFHSGDGLGTGSSDITEGFTSQKQSGDSMIDQLGALVFDENWTPSGAFGKLGQGYNSPFGVNNISFADAATNFLAQMGAVTNSNTGNYDGYAIGGSYGLEKIGSHIRGVQSIYVGPYWGYGKTTGNVLFPAQFGVDYVLSGNTLNGAGTTLGNHKDGGTEEQAAQYNRKGGIYIKQSNPGYGITLLNSATNADHRWSIGVGYGTGTTYVSLYFRYGTDESSVPSTQGYLSSSGGSSQINFTGQHRCEDYNGSLSQTDVGLIVISTGRYNNLEEGDKPTINSALPIVELSSKRNQKSCFGVLSNKEDRNGNPREYSFGNFVSVHDDEDSLDRLIINSLGEGAIWVCNINGNLENGDYITTCEIPGHGMLQDDDLLHNYTVAKITQDCDFELDNPHYDCVEFEFEGNTYRKAFVGCTYHCG